MTASDIVLIAAAAFAAGLVNAIAGGGSLITFPTLLAVGLPPVQASLTNTVALCPGYLGAAIAQRRDLEGQRDRMLRVLPAGALGGVAGALLLLATDDRAFAEIVPFLILFSAVLLATQERLRRWLLGHEHRERSASLAMVPVAIGAVYGGYFGAGLGVIFLAVLGIVIADSLARLNALKQTMSLVVNTAASIVFVVSGEIDWPVAGVMLAGSLFGGAAGGLLATRIPPAALRWTVVTLAVAVAVAYWLT
jgi:uncharacterized membrane protein YfcA